MTMINKMRTRDLYMRLWAVFVGNLTAASQQAGHTS